MSCCTSFISGNRRDDVTMVDPLMDGSTDDSSSTADENNGARGSRFPRWMQDDESNECYNCDSKFNLFNERKHHCRRCRNIFCNTCSNKTAKLLFFSIPDDVRVCDSCYQELTLENNYISNLRPVLYRGDT